MSKKESIVFCRGPHQKTSIYLDLSQAGIILPYLHKEDSIEKEFKIIRSLLLENQRNAERYCKANVSDKAKDVYEMRFISCGRNDRIYCKEFRTNQQRHIVMIHLFEGKKSQQIPKEIKHRLENIGGFIYEF